MNETPRQPPNSEVPLDDKPQLLGTEDQARVSKIAAEEALIREQLKRAKLENEAAEREAKSWHAQYSFVPAPQEALKAIGFGISAGLVFVFALFVLYQPLVDWAKLKAGKEAEIAQLVPEIQDRKNQLLSQQLSEREKQLKTANQNLQTQEERFTHELKNFAERLNRNEEELNNQVQRAQKWKTQAQERTDEYERLAKESETDKTRYQQLALQERERADELTRQLASLQSKVQTAKEQTALVQKQVARRPGHVFRDKLKGGGEGPKMIILAAGNFLMGSPETERYRSKSEGPQRRVTISRPFALSIHEITFAEYNAFAKATGRRLPHDRDWGTGERPVINVSWKDATDYAHWLSKQTGQHYRLPTEAEWEYAARAGSTTVYSFGDDPSRLTNYAWFDSNSDYRTHPVGTKEPNPWDLYDMHGNVWEWVEDVWHGNYLNAPNDGSAWVDVPRNPGSVVRGGGWDYDAGGCRSAFRFSLLPYVNDGAVGFRVARSVALDS